MGSACWKQLSCELFASAVRPSVMLPERFLARGLHFAFFLELASRPSAEDLIQQAYQQYFLVTRFRIALFQSGDVRFPSKTQFLRDPHIL